MEKHEAERDRLLTVTQAAEEFGVHRATIFRLLDEGQLSRIQPGGPGHALRISERELLRSEHRGGARP